MRTTSVKEERIDEPHVSAFICILESLKAWWDEEAAMTYNCYLLSAIHNATRHVSIQKSCET